MEMGRGGAPKAQDLLATYNNCSNASSTQRATASWSWTELQFTAHTIM